MLLLLILSLAQRPEAPLSIHVAPKTIVDATGFREPITKEVTDSVSDLQTELRRRYRGLRLVPTPEDADVSLLVVGRVRTSTPSGAIAMPIGRGAVAAPTYAHRAILQVELVFGDYTKRCLRQASRTGGALPNGLPRMQPPG